MNGYQPSDGDSSKPLLIGAPQEVPTECSALAAERDPLNATWHAIWAAHLIDAGRVDEAMEIARRSIDIDSSYSLSHNMLGEASWAAGRREEALGAFERAHALAPWFGVASGWLAAAYRLTGREDRADALAWQALGQPP